MKTLLPEDIRKTAVHFSQKRKIQSNSDVKSKRILRESNGGLPVAKPNLLPVDLNSSETNIKMVKSKSEKKLKGQLNASTGLTLK